ncbi:MAG: GIY-YIG-like endonuclease [Harvfovirus sp.]|uniref:GIY-YIG-like endonuclease n=1 Tax=Harvfovirus sp. TaxID=2487768 RepID=A0A3G5A0X5_9VIRU|nr:MAG: GIY-YIG-like endonuclease [Harvfovirus sp.]
MEESEKTGVIYLVTNNVNDKKYVGEALSYIIRREKIVRHGIDGRFAEHVRVANKGSEACPKFYNAIRCHGAENFKIELIKVCLKEDLVTEESLEIAKYDCIDNGYNVLAHAHMNIHQTDDRKRMSRIEKISTTMKKVWSEDESYREKTTQANLEAVKNRAISGKTRKLNKDLPNNIYKIQNGYTIRIMRQGKYKITEVSSVTKSDDELLCEAIKIRDKLIAELENNSNENVDHDGNKLPIEITMVNDENQKGYLLMCRKNGKRIDKSFTDSHSNMEEKLKLVKDALKMILESDNIDSNYEDPNEMYGPKILVVRKDHNGDALPQNIINHTARKSHGYKIVIRVNKKRIEKCFANPKLTMDQKLRLAKDALIKIKAQIA